MLPEAEDVCSFVPVAATLAVAVFLVDASVNGNALSAPAVKDSSMGSDDVVGVISIVAREK